MEKADEKAFNAASFGAEIQKCFGIYSIFMTRSADVQSRAPRRSG